MSKPAPARYRTTNWRSYTASLKRHGSLRIWLDMEMTWRAPTEDSPSRPAVFLDAAIQFCLRIEEIGAVTADGAYDTRRCHIAIINRQATTIIPIRKNRRPRTENWPAAIARNDTPRASRQYSRAF